MILQHWGLQARVSLSDTRIRQEYIGSLKKGVFHGKASLIESFFIVLCVCVSVCVCWCVCV